MGIFPSKIIKIFACQEKQKQVVTVNDSLDESMQLIKVEISNVLSTHDDSLEKFKELRNPSCAEF